MAAALKTYGKNRKSRRGRMQTKGSTAHWNDATFSTRGRRGRGRGSDVVVDDGLDTDDDGDFDCGCCHEPEPVAGVLWSAYGDGEALTVDVTHSTIADALVAAGELSPAKADDDGLTESPHERALSKIEAQAAAAPLASVAIAGGCGAADNQDNQDNDAADAKISRAA
mmetsp:Transcript_51999/g.144016  ORF Transcript_51999/g.144016 Transcript_51999/m.144016 type:complete len:168 (-) Transcript_51999:41-544(-)